MDKAMKELKRHIREVTAGLCQEDYMELMSELGHWATIEAEMAEYTPEMEFEHE